MNRQDDVAAVFTDSRDIASDGAEGLGPGAGAKRAGDFLFELDHTDITLGQVVVEGDVEVVHERQDFPPVLIEPFEQVP